MLKLFKKLSLIFRNQNGMTLVEVVIAVFLIAIVTTALVEGTITAVNALKINKAKSQAIAIANEKIELIRTIDYDALDITENNPNWSEDYSALSEPDFNIEYDISWVNGEENSYKQIKVSVFREPMKLPVEVVTQIFPAVGTTNITPDEHPAPSNLIIESDSGYGENRVIALSWEAPLAEVEIDNYNIYIDGVFLSDSILEVYLYHPGNDDNFTFTVTAYYSDDMESEPSNSVSTDHQLYYPAPTELVIDGYEGSGSNRIVNLSWQPPETGLSIAEYRIYRNGEYIGSTGSENYQDNIGQNIYTYYVTALYSGSHESEPSNSVTVEPEPNYAPPQNLRIAGYSGGGNNRKVNLQWDAPDTQLTVLEYRIYRNGIFVGSTINTSYQNTIGKKNYSFYVTAVYEGSHESEPSNTVTTH